MKLFAISDLHLSFHREKPMDIFGPNWTDHHRKVENNWKKAVTDEDTVILGGDFSWALKLDEVVPDATFVDQLPGQKVLFKGNHDYWWQSYTKVKQVLPPSLFPVQNNYYPFDRDAGIALCGTRGWSMLKEDSTEHDRKIFNRELHRLELSLDSARQDGYEHLIVTLHYPPLAKDQGGGVVVSEFVDLMTRYHVSTCLYGHLHGEDHQKAVTGMVRDVNFYFVSSDYLDFCPLEIETTR